MEGELRDRQLVAALRSVGRSHRTGILTVQGRDEIIALSFSNGGVVGADALNQSLEEGLGEVLASQHLVDSSEFSALAAEHEAGGGRVVDLLVERSFLSRSQLLESLRLHTYRLCLEALSWSSGEYRYYEGDEVAHEAGMEPIGVGELLVRASLELGAAGPLTLPIPDLDETYGRTSTVFAESDDQGLEGGAGGALHLALGLLDGQRTLRDVAASGDLSPYDVRDVASEWLQAGIIERTGERSEAPAVESSSYSVLRTALPDVELGSSVGLEPSPRHDGPATATGQRVPGVSKTEGRWPQLVDRGLRWLNRVYGLGILAATLALLTFGPAKILLPFPWQGALMEGLQSQQSSVQRLNIERGAHTFFLLFGRYPENLDELETRGLVKPADLVVHDGERWGITARPASFVLSASASYAAEGTSWTSSIAGNFLLDPEFVRPAPVSEGPLLVLLD